MNRNLFLIELLFRYIGNMTLFDKTENFTIIPIDDKMTYVIGTEKNDLEALLNMTDETKKQTCFQSNAYIAIEAKDIPECFQILLAHVRSGKPYRNDFDLDCTPYLNETALDEKPLIKGIDLDNWPIEIKEIIKFPYCGYLNRRYKRSGLLVCGGENKKPTEGDLCPIISMSSALDDGECPISAYVFDWTRQMTVKNQEVEIKFSLKEIN